MRNADPDPSAAPPDRGESEWGRAAMHATHLLPPAEPPDIFDPDLPESFGAGFGRDSATEAFGRAEPQKKDGASQGKSGKKPEGRHRPGDEHPKKNGEESSDEESDEKSGEEKSGGEGDAEESDQDQENQGEESGEKEGDEESEGDKGEQKKKKPGKPPLYKRPVVIITFIVVVLLLIAAAIIWWLWARQYASTDDAYIDGNVTQISPQASAQILARFIDDNMLVKKGDLVVELDPTDFEVSLQAAQASAQTAQGKLAQAQTQVGAAQATVEQNQAEIAAAQVQLDNAKQNLERYQSVDPRARTDQQLDDAEAAEKNAQAQLDQAQARKNTAEANLKAAQAAVGAAQGDLASAQAQAKQAQVNLGYCKIYAPSDGRVTSRAIEAGMYVTAGQAMFSLVSPDVWVTANFKETQLTHMRVGDPVSIKVDAFPGKKYQGHVESIQAGSGARFSVLPAENATGNFVKIVQRVPVKIVFDPGNNIDDSHLLSPGLSVEPRVKVR